MVSHDQPPTPHTAGTQPTRRRWVRTRRALVLLLVTGLALWWCHPWLLRAFAVPLIHQSEVGRVDLLIVFDGNSSYEFAADQLATGMSRQLALYEQALSRTEELGVEDTHLEITQKVAEQLGVPEDQTILLDGEFRAIEEVLAEAIRLQASGVDVGLVVEEWGSQLLFERMCRLPASSELPRLFVAEDPEVQLENWWKTRHGVRVVVMSWCRLLAFRCCDAEVVETRRTEEDFRRAAVNP